MRKKRAEDSVKTHEFPFAFHDEANHTHFFFGVSPTTHTKKAIPSPPTDSHQETYNSGFKLSFHPTKKHDQITSWTDEIWDLARSTTTRFFPPSLFFLEIAYRRVSFHQIKNWSKKKKAVPIRRWCPNQPPQHYTGGATRLLLAFFFPLRNWTEGIKNQKKKIQGKSKDWEKRKT